MITSSRSALDRTWQLKFTTTEQVRAALDTLVATGLFGITVGQVAEALLRERIRELELEGWLK